jgi:hypothetical protein
MPTSVPLQSPTRSNLVDLIGPDPTRSDPIDPIRPDQTRSDPIRPDQTPPYHAWCSCSALSTL